MNELTIRHRGEDKNYSDDAIKDMLKMWSFIDKAVSLLIDLQDNDFLDTESQDSIYNLLEKYEEGLFGTEEDD